MTYLIFPALIWAVLRFGQRGGTFATALTFAISAWATTHYEGPFIYHSITRTVLSEQLFITVVAISTLFLAAVVSEREAFAERLGESRAQVFTAAEAERRRIERNVHDGAQQRLLALAARLRLADGDNPAFVDAEHELQLAIQELRELSHGVHPSILSELGLADAVRSIVARSAIPAMVLGLPTRQVDSEIEEAAYFVVAEAVANAHKHTSATLLCISVATPPHLLELEVIDDGAGGAVERPGSGLEGLRGRVEALGGEFRVESSSRGTTIKALMRTEPR